MRSSEMIDGLGFATGCMNQRQRSIRNRDQIRGRRAYLLRELRAHVT